MLASLYENTLIPFDHYIVDNGSIDGTKEFLKSIESERVKIILNSENRGVPVACNQALRAIGDNYDFIIKMDNDCEITTVDWLRPILEIINGFNRRIILSPQVNGLGLEIKRYKRLSYKEFTVGLTRHVGGICVVAPAEVYKFYRFNEKGPMHGNHDIDFSYKVQKKGYLMGYVEEIKAWHMDTTEGQHRKYPSYFQERWARESRHVYGEHQLITKIKRPFRRAALIHKLHYLGLEENGVLYHALKRIKRDVQKVFLLTGKKEAQ
jgi:GT2 family glycosyltransferase